MDISEIKEGQKLRFTGLVGCVAGCIGTCTYIDSCGGLIAMEFETPRAGLHSCKGHCKEGHGYWCTPCLLEPVEEEVVEEVVEEEVEEEVVDNSIPCAPPPVDVTATNRGMSKDQVDVHIARLEDVVETFFTIGVSRQDMLELFNDISKKHFSEKQLRDRIATIKDKVTKCQN